jgi:hypothetical protein
MKEIQDYINLSAEEFETKYGEDKYDELQTKVRDITFNASLVTPFMQERRASLLEDGASEESAATELQRVLKNKGFNRVFYNRYTMALAQPKSLTFESIIETLGIEYYNQPLKLKDLEKDLNIDKLSIPSGIEDTLKETIKVQTIDPKYSEGTKSLVEAIESDTGKITTQAVSLGLVDIINPLKTQEREDFYEFWEGIHPLFDDMKETIEDVLREWQDISKDFEEDEEGNKKRVEELVMPDLEDSPFEELGKEMRQLAKLYQKMDDMNYVLNVEPINYKIQSDDDEEIFENVQSMIIDYIEKVSEFESRGGIDSDYDDDDDPSYDKPYDSEGQTDSRTNEKGSATMAEKVGDIKETEREVYRKAWAVDPLTVVGAILDKFKAGVFMPKSYKKFMKQFDTERRQIERDDPYMVNVLWELSQWLEEAKDELVVDVKSNYYVPATKEMIRALTLHAPDSFSDKEKKIVSDIDELYDFHKELIILIQEIIEVDENRSVAPWITDRSDTVASTSREGNIKLITEDSASESTPQFDSFILGNTGTARDLKQYSDSITKLVNIMQEYYVVPAQSEFLPFSDTPRFLTTSFLGKTKVTGAESIYQLIELGYYSLGAQMIDRHEVEALNKYIELFKFPSDIKIRDAIIYTEELLDVLDIVFEGKFSENDKEFFARRIKNVAKDNDIEITNEKLNGESINDLAEKYSKKPNSYYLLLKLMLSYKGMFLKDSKKEKEMKELYNLLEGLKMPIEFSLQQKIILMHDDIRKMDNKPIHYRYARLDDFDDMEETINIIKSRHKQDVTATDVTSIVMELGSINGLSKKHGLSEEVIYHIKGLYR